MVASAAGTVVLVQFPFSDPSRTKLRPAVVLADVGRDDRILCQAADRLVAERTKTRGLINSHRRSAGRPQPVKPRGELQVGQYANPKKKGA